MGKWLPSALGFAKKAGLAVDKLSVIKDAKGRDVLFAKRSEKGKLISQLIPDIVLSSLKKMPLPIAMRWGSHETPFYRPVHWIVSILDKQIVPLTFFGIKAGNSSYGHRFLTQDQNPAHYAMGARLKITSPENYEEILKKGHVIVDPSKRRATIQRFLKSKGAEGEDKLLDEVVNLVESPKPLLGRYDKRYLELPDLVRVACMAKHQKSFPVYKKKKLSTEFIVVADSVTKKNEATILSWNQTVLQARLEDVRFFWEEDLKTKLDDFVTKLDHVVFQKNMGTIGDKVKRIQTLSKYLTKHLSLIGNSTYINRTALLCKADLVTQMVGELPALQGIMGQLFAEKSGLREPVCKGIAGHYLPRFEADIVPDIKAIGGPASIVVGIADRIDTIVCCYENGLHPTGSKDPWAIRRAMLAILRIVIENKLTLNINELISESYKALSKRPEHREKLSAFFVQRIKQYFLDQGLPYDAVEAVLHHALTNPLEASRKINALAEAKKTKPSHYKRVIDTGVRVMRLAKEAKGSDVDPSLFIEKNERLVWEAFQNLAKTKDIAPIQYFSRLQTLSDPITDFFDHVLIMDKDKTVRKNRLALLSRLDSFYAGFADFEKLVV